MKVYSFKSKEIIFGYLITAGLIPALLKISNFFSDQTIINITGICVILWTIWMIIKFIKTFTVKFDNPKYAKYVEKKN